MSFKIQKIIRLIPAIFFVLFSSIALIIYFWILSNHEHNLYNITSTTSEQVSLRTEAWIDARIQALNQLAEVVPPKPFSSEEIYSGSALKLFNSYSGLQAINWIDSALVIRVVVPYESNLAALGKSLKNHQNDEVMETVLNAQKTGKIQRTTYINLFQGGVGFASYLPIKNQNGETLGYINAVFRIEDLISSCLVEDQLRKQFNYAFFAADGRLLYNHGYDENVTLENGLICRNTRILDKEWQLIMSPSDTFIRESSPDGKRVYLLAGITFSFIISLLIRSVIKYQESLHQKEAQYRLLFESSRDPIYITALDGSVIAVNPAMSSLFGYSQDELLQMKSTQLFVNPDDRTKLIDSMINKKSVKDYEVLLAHKSGKQLICLINGIVREDNKDHKITFQGSIRDITEHVELEEKMNQAQKMEAIGRLAGGIAHDFNNLLTVISGNVEILDMSLEKDSDLRILTGEVEKTVRKAADLIKRLLTFSRKDMVKPEIMNLNSLLVDIEFMLERLINENIEKSFNVTSEELFIKADRVQIEQIIMNLAVNARDAMPNGGSLEFDISGIDLDEEFLEHHKNMSPGKYALIKISDTGKGIPEDFKQHIFEPFFTTKDSSKGTGLGLATVYGIVKRLDGLITFTSDTGIGTTFNIYLPVVDSPEIISTLDVDNNIQLNGNERILVIEDNETVRNTAVRVLNGFGYLVDEASGSFEAEKLIKSGKSKYDLILSDVIMPGKTGPELLSGLKNNIPDTKILFMSGYSEELFGEDGNIEKDINLLPKPFHPVDLAKRIRTILDN